MFCLLGHKYLFIVRCAYIKRALTELTLRQSPADVRARRNTKKKSNTYFSHLEHMDDVFYIYLPRMLNKKGMCAGKLCQRNNEAPVIHKTQFT